MAAKKIIAYFMHEHEDALISQNINPGYSRNQSFYSGTIDEEKLNALTQAGIIYNIIEDEKEEMDVLNEKEINYRGTHNLRKIVTDKTAKLLIKRGFNAFEPEKNIYPGYYKFSITGPLLEDYKRQLDELGLTILEFSPPNYYTVQLKTRELLSKLKTLPFINEVSYYDSVDTGKFESLANEIIPVIEREKKMLLYDVLLHSASDKSAFVKYLETNHITIAGTGDNKVRCYLPEGSTLPDELYRHPMVSYLSQYIKPKLHNDLARQIIGSDKLSAAATPALSYEGEGEIIGIADTGIDSNHPDLKNNLHGEQAWGIVGSTKDFHGHGTHVAGSVAGDGNSSGGQIRGTAPKAKIFFQALLDEKGELNLPVQLKDLFEQAYAQGVRIHNNSWGSSTQSKITASSIEADQFVWDHKDMLLVFSAGNDGKEGNTGNVPPGYVDFLSIGSPASAKNVLTVGASRSSRDKWGYAPYTYQDMWPELFPDPPYYDQQNVSGDPDSLAGFSSRGPCDDDRLKPDIVAPGTDIISTRSSTASPSNFWALHPTNNKYALMGGTSMSAPIVTGCAAVIREYYVKAKQIQPSAALLKATIINSCRKLKGYDATLKFADLPNFNQGFGMIDMMMAIPSAANNFFLWSHDNYMTPAEHFRLTGQRLKLEIKMNQPGWLRACLAYTDYPARAIQNKINMFIDARASTKNKWRGNMNAPALLIAPDSKNNVEAITIDNANSDIYTLVLTASNIPKGPQDFALVITSGDTTATVTILRPQ